MQVNLPTSQNNEEESCNFKNRAEIKKEQLLEAHIVIIRFHESVGSAPNVQSPDVAQLKESATGEHSNQTISLTFRDGRLELNQSKWKYINMRTMTSVS